MFIGFWNIQNRRSDRKLNLDKRLCVYVFRGTMAAPTVMERRDHAN